MFNIIQGMFVFFHFVSMISDFMSVFRKLKQLIEESLVLEEVFSLF